MSSRIPPNYDNVEAVVSAIERRGKQTRVLGTVITLVLLAVAAIALGVLLNKIADAQRQLDAKQDELQKTDSQIKTKQRELAEVQASLSEALAELSRAANSQQQKKEVASLIERIPEQSRQKVVEQTYEKSPDAARSVARVYLQIAGESQRPLAQRLQKLLASEGFVVPGIERVARAPRESELRFFRSEEGPTARRIVALASRAGLNLSPQLIQGRKAPVNQFEVWLAQK